MARALSRPSSRSTSNNDGNTNSTIRDRQMEELFKEADDRLYKIRHGDETSHRKDEVSDARPRATPRWWEIALAFPLAPRSLRHGFVLGLSATSVLAARMAQHRSRPPRSKPERALLQRAPDERLRRHGQGL